MNGKVRLIDPAVKDEVLRFPTVELIRMLFPGVPMRGRSYLCNPLRGEKHPSLSCYRGYDGYQHWKDHATGETGDNLDFYRKVFPELSYVEALDRLSLLVLGRSALQDYVPGVSVPFYSRERRQPVIPVRQHEEKPVLNIMKNEPYSAAYTPSELVSYVRGRGISDEVAGRFLRYVVYENANRKGKTLIDSSSGLPVLNDGEPVQDSGLREAVAMPNDIGGFSLRTPPSGETNGFKGASASFITTILSGGMSPQATVSLSGEGDGLVRYFSYDERSRSLWFNPTQAFVGVGPWAAAPSMVFLDAWTGRFLNGRDLKGALAVLNALNGRMSGEVDVVEGMFDAVSDIEFERMAGREPVPVRDLVVLNSTSNLRWAVPFLAMHRKVHSLLDNDMRSGTGQKAFDVIRDQVAEFASRIGSECQVQSDSGVFYPQKDMNDYLRSCKETIARRQDEAAVNRSARRSPRKNEMNNSVKNRK